MPERHETRGDRVLRTAMILAGLAVLLTVLGRFYHDAFGVWKAREQPFPAEPTP